MKKILVAGIAAAAFLSAPALAAPPSPMFNWTGWYVGGHAGYGWAKSQEMDGLPFLHGLIIGTPCAIFTAWDCEHELHGFIGGGQAGYNWQAGNWIFGVEASFSGADLSGTETISVVAGSNTFATKIRSLLLTTGRLGYASNRTLLYVKGGYAGGSTRFTVTGGGGPGADTATTTSWHNGWVVGTGIEYALTPNWIVGVEYSFADLGSKTRNAVGSVSGVVSPVSVDVDKFQSLLARLSYKFGSH